MLGRGRWAIKKEADFWKDLIFTATLGKRPTIPLKTAKLVLVRGSSKTPDFDGLAISFKRPVDALILAGVIEDDSMKHIGIPEFRWVKTAPKKGYIEIFVNG